LTGEKRKGQGKIYTPPYLEIHNTYQKFIHSLEYLNLHVGHMLIKFKFAVCN